MTWPVVVLLAAVYVGAVLRIAYWIGGLLRDAEVVLEREILSCMCRKGAVHPRCPRHGWERAGAEDPAKLKIGERAYESR